MKLTSGFGRSRREGEARRRGLLRGEAVTILCPLRRTSARGWGPWTDAEVVLVLDSYGQARSDAHVRDAGAHDAGAEDSDARDRAGERALFGPLARVLLERGLGHEELDQARRSLAHRELAEGLGLERRGLREALPCVALEHVEDALGRRVVAAGLRASLGPSVPEEQGAP